MTIVFDTSMQESCRTLRGGIALRTREVRPASCNPAEVQGPGGRGRDQGRKRSLHQGLKTRQGLHAEAGYMAASVPKRVFELATSLTARAGPYIPPACGSFLVLQDPAKCSHITTCERGLGYDSVPSWLAAS